MAARKLAQSANTRCQTKRAAPRTAWKKGQSGNPGGLSSEQRAAADANRALVQSHGSVLLPDGRTRVQAILDSVLEHGLSGSAPHSQLYLAYTVGKPQDNLRVEGDISLAIRKRVYTPLDDADSHG